jgi:HEAT repeat protein
MRKAHVLATVIVVLLALLASPAAFGQDAKGGSKELTIEELFLKSVQFQILREKAFSEDYDVKMSALDDLEKMINDRTVGDNTARVEFVLEYLSMEGSLRTVKEDRRQVNNFPEVRRRAAGMLGRLGGQQSVNALITVLLGDSEPMVKAEAAYGLGTIGLNEKNEAVEALAFAIDREDPTQPDNNFAMAVSLALEKIGKKTGGVTDPAAYRALVKIAQGNYLKIVKAKAFQVLDTMKQQGK